MSISFKDSINNNIRYPYSIDITLHKNSYHYPQNKLSKSINPLELNPKTNSDKYNTITNNNYMLHLKRDKNINLYKIKREKINQLIDNIYDKYNNKIHTYYFDNLSLRSFDKLPSYYFNALPHRSFKEIATYNVNIGPRRTFKKICTHNFNSLPHRSFNKIPSDTFNSLPHRSSKKNFLPLNSITKENIINIFLSHSNKFPSIHNPLHCQAVTGKIEFKRKFLFNNSIKSNSKKHNIK